MEKKEWANPTPAGLVALAVACFCFFGLLNGLVSAAAAPLLGCWLLGGFVVQVIVALLDLKSGNHTGGNTFLFFSAFFMLASGIALIFKYNGATAGAPLDSSIDGFAWLALTLTVWLWTPAFMKTFNMLSLIILCLDIACPVIALMDLSILPKEASFIPAYALLFAGIVGVYYAAALIVNTAYGKKVYPILDRVWKKNRQ